MRNQKGSMILWLSLLVIILVGALYWYWWMQNSTHSSITTASEHSIRQTPASQESAPVSTDLASINQNSVVYTNTALGDPTFNVSGFIKSGVTKTRAYLVPSSYAGASDETSVVGFLRPKGDKGEINGAEGSTNTINTNGGAWSATFGLIPNGTYKIYLYGGDNDGHSTLLTTSTVSIKK
jgi:hypothetical protein